MIFCDDNYLKIETDIEPCARARTILPCMTEEEKKDIQKKPFICTRNVNFFITDKRDNEEYRILIPKNYTWDGCTIPRFAWSLIGLSKENVNGIIASAVHDKLTECKYLIAYNRKLSTLIFKELCIAGNMPKWKANFICWFVDNFQKLQKGWRNV